MPPSNPPCPRCNRPGHSIPGLVTAAWVPYRDPIEVRDEAGEVTHTVYKQGTRLAGGMRFGCECGHQYTAERPVHLSSRRPQRARPRRGF